MWKTTTLILVTACIAFLLIGCTSARESVKPSVLLLVDNIESYDEALGKYVAAENQYYHSLQRVLVESAGRATVVDQGNQRIASVDRYIDDLLLESEIVSVTKLKEFLEQTDEELNALVIAQRVAEAEVSAAAEASFQKLQDARNELQKLEGQLLQVIREPPVTEQITWWIEYGKTVKDKYDELNEAEEQNGG